MTMFSQGAGWGMAITALAASPCDGPPRAPAKGQLRLVPRFPTR
jgi:hypothetical protein